MSEHPKAHAILRRLLETTREEELDCDRFLALLPPLLDGRIEDATLREQLEHHVRQCAECDEELRILKEALALDPE
jgi:Putative zinc-finger